MRHFTDRAGPDRRGGWRSAVAGVAALALIITPGAASAEEPEGAGNNLKMPVIWAEDTILPSLRMGEASQDALLEGTPVNVTTPTGTATIFLQQEVDNEWQAENLKLTESGLPVTDDGRLPVTFVDWGDNLEVKDWSTKQKIRVEMRLLQDVSSLVDTNPADPEDPSGMTGYEMLKYGEETGPDEMWGVVATKVGNDWVANEEQATEAFVYTGKVCLTIERVDNAKTELWDPVSRTWTGKSVLNTCLGENEGGLNGLSAEVTISGGMTYGSVWDPGGLPDGLYRMTFSLQKESKVDITDESALYVSEEPGEEPGDAKTAVALVVEEAGSGGSGSGGSGSGGAPEGNQAVIRPDLNLTYLDVGMSFTQGNPTRPVNLEAAPGVEQMTLTWDPPVYEGTSPITAYIVTAGVYGQYSVDASTTSTTITGLPGGVKTIFTVVAVNDQGPGDETAVDATPRTKETPSPTTPPTTPPSATPPSVTPPTEIGQAVTVRVRATNGAKKLYVNVGPNKGKGYYQFTVQKLSNGKWRTLPKVYKTYGKGETRRLRLSKGIYRVIVLPRYGYQGATSEMVALRGATPPSVVPPTEVGQAVTLRARAKSGDSKMYVNVDPNKGKGYWQFVVQKVSGDQWRALSKVYKTKASAERRTLNLRRGTYRVLVMPRYGYAGAMSDAFTLLR